MIIINNENNINLINYVINNNLYKIKQLFKKDLNLNYQDSYGNTVLFYALKNENYDIFNLLLLNNINPNLKNKTGNTILIYSCIIKNTTFIRMLLNNPNINLNITDNYNNTAYNYIKLQIENIKIHKDYHILKIYSLFNIKIWLKHILFKYKCKQWLKFYYSPYFQGYLKAQNNYNLSVLNKQRTDIIY